MWISTLMLENIENVFPLRIGVVFSDSTFVSLPDKTFGALPERIVGLLPESSVAEFSDSAFRLLCETRSTATLSRPAEQRAERLQLLHHGRRFLWRRRLEGEVVNQEGHRILFLRRRLGGRRRRLGGKQPVFGREGQDHGKENRHNWDLEHVSHHLDSLELEVFASEERRLQTDIEYSCNRRGFKWHFPPSAK